MLVLCATSLHAKDIRIAHIYDKTGPLESYGIQTQRGLELGIEYATQGAMAVNGNKIVIIERDARGKPDVAKSQLAAAYEDDKADIAVGPTSSGEALAMLPVAEEYKKILLVEPATAEAITGDKWNRYIFRTARNSSQDAGGAAAALDKPGVSIGTLVQDYAFGRDGIKAFKEALKNAKVVHEEYLPFDTSDFTAGAQRLFDALKDKPGRKIIYIKWAGVGNPYKIAELDPKRFGIEIAPMHFGAQKSQIRQRERATQGESKLAPQSGGHGELLAAMEAMKLLVASLGVEQVKRIAELLG